ncbi:peptidase S8/S53 domain-containing protein [Amylocarpus encephaloides]|uniref:Peptidase S8/S53 domain-containing protein n=1 Tax=Amylocarpus encephaloides TaxID=45428 RepID=A0A9P8CAA4_9HELO|nr:peptidase S8/S53 domain-containing protein [Amylocarpus encephaloides]
MWRGKEGLYIWLAFQQLHSVLASPIVWRPSLIFPRSTSVMMLLSSTEGFSFCILLLPLLILLSSAPSSIDALTQDPNAVPDGANEVTNLPKPTIEVSTSSLLSPIVSTINQGNGTTSNTTTRVSPKGNTTTSPSSNGTLTATRPVPVNSTTLQTEAPYQNTTLLSTLSPSPLFPNSTFSVPPIGNSTSKSLITTSPSSEIPTVPLSSQTQFQNASTTKQPSSQEITETTQSSSSTSSGTNFIQPSSNITETKSSNGTLLIPPSISAGTTKSGLDFPHVIPTPPSASLHVPTEGWHPTKASAPVSSTTLTILPPAISNPPEDAPDIITSTLTAPPAAMFTEIVNNTDWKNNFWLTTSRGGGKTVVPVLVGCKHCGGKGAGMVLWNIPSLPKVSFQFPGFPGLPKFHFPSCAVKTVCPNTQTAGDGCSTTTSCAATATACGVTGTTSTSTPTSAPLHRVIPNGLGQDEEANEKVRTLLKSFNPNVPGAYRESGFVGVDFWMVALTKEQRDEVIALKLTGDPWVENDRIYTPFDEGPISDREENTKREEEIEQPINSSAILLPRDGTALLSRDEGLTGQRKASETLKFINWQEGHELEEYDDNYWFDKSSGKDIPVYVIDRGVNLGLAEFTKGSNIASRTRWIHAGPADQRREDAWDEKGKGHGTCMLSLIAGHKLGVAKNINPVIVRIAEPAKPWDWLEGVQLAMRDLSVGNTGSQQVKTRAIVLMSWQFPATGVDRPDDFDKWSAKMRLMLRMLELNGALILTGSGNHPVSEITNYPAVLGAEGGGGTALTKRIDSLLVVGAAELDGKIWNHVFSQTATDPKRNLPHLWAPSYEGNLCASVAGIKEYAGGTSLANAVAAGVAAYYLGLSSVADQIDTPLKFKEFLLEKAWIRPAAKAAGTDYRAVWNGVPFEAINAQKKTCQHMRRDEAPASGACQLAPSDGDTEPIGLPHNTKTNPPGVRPTGSPSNNSTGPSNSTGASPGVRPTGSPSNNSTGPSISTGASPGAPTQSDPRIPPGIDTSGLMGIGPIPTAVTSSGLSSGATTLSTATAAISPGPSTAPSGNGTTSMGGRCMEMQGCSPGAECPSYGEVRSDVT